MNAEVLRIISIAAFSLAGVLALVSIFLFFKLDVRAIINDLSGKTAERQIRELREQNHMPVSNRNGRVLYEPSQEKATAKLENDKKKETSRLGRTRKMKEEEATTVLQNEEEEATTVLQNEEEEETTVLQNEAEEATTVLQNEAEEATTVLQNEAEEATTVLAPEMGRKLSGGYRLILDEMVVHTRERI